jgi:hypothetical protein
MGSFLWFPGRGGRGKSKSLPLAAWESIVMNIHHQLDIMSNQTAQGSP